MAQPRRPRPARPDPTADRARTRSRKNAQHLETLGGLLGFFTVAVLAVTVYAEVTGRSAGVYAFLLLLLVVADVVVWRAGRDQRRRSDG